MLVVFGFCVRQIAVSIWHRGPGSPPIAVGLDDDIAVGIDVGWHRGPGSPPIDVGIDDGIDDGIAVGIDVGGGWSDEPELDDR